MSKGKWHLALPTNISLATAKRGLELQDRHGNLDTSQIPEHDVFSAKEYARHAGFRNYQYFIRSVVGAEGMFTHQKEELEVQEGQRPVTLYMTSVNTAVYEGERYREWQQQKRKEKALRQNLMASSGYMANSQ